MDEESLNLHITELEELAKAGTIAEGTKDLLVAMARTLAQKYFLQGRAAGVNRAISYVKAR